MFESLKTKMEQSGRCSVHLDNGVKKIVKQERKVSVFVGDHKEIIVDKVISTVDGIALKSIIEESEGIEDKDSILESLGHCDYGAIASCNIIYKDEMS